MIIPSTSFGDDIFNYLASELPKVAELDTVLTTIKTILRRQLSQVFEGILLPSSCLCVEPHVIPQELVEVARSLAENGVYFLLIDDDSVATATLKGALKHPIIVPSGIGVDAVASIVNSLASQIEERGFHFERIAIVGDLSRPQLKEVLKGYSAGTEQKDLPLIVFATDFELSYVTYQDFRPIPIVNQSNELLQGAAATKYLFSALMFAPRLNVRETAQLVTGSGILERLDEIAVKARQNLQSGIERLGTEYVHLNSQNGIFDHRSGAVAFSPSGWRSLPENLHESHIIDYFQERLSGYWQPGRPCYKRILFTPSSVLLRGERYYANMKNISPLERIREMLGELGDIQQLVPAFRRLKIQIGDERASSWKLALAFLDQFRNIGLQLFSFAHATEMAMRSIGHKRGINGASAEAIRAALEVLYDGEKPFLHSFVGKSVRAYYYWLLGDLDNAEDTFVRGVDYTMTINARFLPVCSDLEKLFSSAQVDAGELRVEELVRRWREADHPGENLLVALQAVEEARNCGSIDAVGIGWGGIELPLVVQHLAKVRQVAASGRVSAYIANWSHYRNEKSDIKWVRFPEYETRPPSFEGERSVLLDDNVLSGITLERVRNEMILQGASDVSIYVTRFSGERRLAHMKMKGHGVIDPDFMLNHVRGYLGETPFSRSWSTKVGDYKSKVGVFSLARRRILECIHNNSTVEAWDREGF